MKILILIVLCGIPAFAQQPNTLLRGQVVDDLGGLVVGAKIMLVDEKGAERETTTDSSGNYSLSNIAPGTYLLRIDATGFSTLELRDLVLVAEKTRTLRSTLSVAPLRQEVTVPDNWRWIPRRAVIITLWYCGPRPSMPCQTILTL